MCPALPSSPEVCTVSQPTSFVTTETMSTPLEAGIDKTSSSSTLCPKATGKFREKWIVLFILSTLVIIGRSSYTLLSQAFKESLTPGEDKELRVPIFITMVETLSVVVIVPVWLVICYMKTGTVSIENPRYRIKMYAICSLLDCVNTVFASVGLSILPPVC